MWKSRLLFLAVLLSAVGLIIGYVGSNIGFWLLYIWVGLLLISIFSMVFLKGQTEVIQEIDNTFTFKNKGIGYRVNVKNKGIFIYPRIEQIFYNRDVVDYLGLGSGVSQLLPFGKISKQYEIMAPYRGVYTVGLDSVIITDFLGLFRRRIWVKEPIVVVVYPKYNLSFQLPTLTEPQQLAQQQDFYAEEDYTTVADIRKYTPSDNPKTIHWKLSAKWGELMVKRYSNLEPNRVLVFVDTYPTKHAREERAALEDKMASYCASIVNYCVKSNLPARVILGSPGFKYIQVTHPTEVDKLLPELARLEFNNGDSSIRSLAVYDQLYNNVIITSDINEVNYIDIQNLISYDHKTVVYYFYLSELGLSAEKQVLLDSLEHYGVEVEKIAVDCRKDLHLNRETAEVEDDA